MFLTRPLLELSILGGVHGGRCTGLDRGRLGRRFLHRPPQIVDSLHRGSDPALENLPVDLMGKLVQGVVRI